MEVSQSTDGCLGGVQVEAELRVLQKRLLGMGMGAEGKDTSATLHLSSSGPAKARAYPDTDADPTDEKPQQPVEEGPIAAAAAAAALSECKSEGDVSLLSLLAGSPGGATQAQAGVIARASLELSLLADPKGRSLSPRATAGKR